MGSKKYVHHVLNEKVEQIAEQAEKAVKVLEGERQSLWSVVKWSLSQRFEYWLQLSYPSDVKEAAASLSRITDTRERTQEEDRVYGGVA